MTQQTLPEAAHEHHERILAHVDRMPGIADGLLAGSREDAARGIREIREFLTGMLIPHIDAAERAVYPQLERMFQNRHSMAPMRREHQRIRDLGAEFGRLADEAGDRRTLGRTLAMRRVLFQLYALLKIHLAEEEAYLRLLEHGVTDDVADAVKAALEHPVVGS